MREMFVIKIWWWNIYQWFHF